MDNEYTALEDLEEGEYGWVWSNRFVEPEPLTLETMEKALEAFRLDLVTFDRWGYAAKATQFPILSLSRPICVDDVLGIEPIPPLSPCCQAETFIEGSRRVCDKCRLSQPL